MLFRSVKSVIVAREQRVGVADLLEVRRALDVVGLRLRRAERRQQHPREDSDDRDDDQQFNERERASTRSGWFRFPLVNEVSLRCGNARVH